MRLFRLAIQLLLITAVTSTCPYTDTSVLDSVKATVMRVAKPEQLADLQQLGAEDWCTKVQDAAEKKNDVQMMRGVATSCGRLSSIADLGKPGVLSQCSAAIDMWREEKKAKKMKEATEEAPKACGDFNSDVIVKTCEESDKVCEALFQTKGGTCEEECAAGGMVCEDGWDELPAGTCQKKTSGQGNGCTQKLGNQICRCKAGDSAVNTKFATQAGINFCDALQQAGISDLEETCSECFGFSIVGYLFCVRECVAVKCNREIQKLVTTESIGVCMAEDVCPAEEHLNEQCACEPPVPDPDPFDPLTCEGKPGSGPACGMVGATQYCCEPGYICENEATNGCKCNSQSCEELGDPHVYMFSGDKGSPMGKGEFVLVEHKTFSVHSCHTPLGAHASRSSGFAIRSPLGLIKILRHGSPVVPSGVEVTKNGDFVFPDGEIVRASGSNGHISIIIPESRLAAGVKGLCGKYNPEAKLRDAFSNSTGHVVLTPDITKGESGWGKDYVLHFQDSFRVAPEDALFTEEECPRGDVSSTVVPQRNPVYHGGDQAEKFEWTDCPSGMKVAAEKMCPQGLLFEECLHDVARTCDLAEWVRHTNEAHNHLKVLPHGPHVSFGDAQRHR